MEDGPLRMASQGLPDAETIVEPIYAVSRSWDVGLHIIRYWLVDSEALVGYPRIGCPSVPTQSPTRGDREGDEGV